MTKHLTRYYAIRIGDFVEIRSTTAPLKMISSTLTRKVSPRKSLTLSQVWYDGGKVMAVWSWDQLNRTFMHMEPISPDGYIKLTKAQATLLSQKRKGDIRW